jgi:hypothetical protein
MARRPVLGRSKHAALTLGQRLVDMIRVRTAIPGDANGRNLPIRLSNAEQDDA